MTRRSWAVAVATLASLAGTSCAVPEEDVCAAVVSYGEPALTIVSATGPDGRPVDVFELSRVTEYGHPATRDLRARVQSGRPWTPATVSAAAPFFGLELGPGGSVMCRVPCGFTMAGDSEVTFMASMRGQPGERWQVRPGYSSQDSSCEGTLRGGTHIDLRFGAAGQAGTGTGSGAS